MLNKKFINKIEKKLKKEKKNLEKNLAAFTEKNIHNLDDYKAKYPELGNEVDENAKEVAIFENRLNLESTLEKELRDVNNTLKRIDEGTYGMCHSCKKEIPEARLEARPTASTCVECKERLKGEK